MNNKVHTNWNNDNQPTIRTLDSAGPEDHRGGRGSHHLDSEEMPDIYKLFWKAKRMLKSYIERVLMCPKLIATVLEANRLKAL